MQIQEKLKILTGLGEYIKSNDEKWVEVKELASRQNYWFIPQFIDDAVEAIATQYLTKEILLSFIASYELDVNDDIDQSKKLGIVMAGNIPLVGFHDFMMGFLAGYELNLKLSSKDEVLIKHLIEKMIEWEPSLSERIYIQKMLQGCDLYIATGSNNTAQTFAYYFGKYPNLIRHNRTSIAVLTGKESDDELKALVNDIYQYFGLGCRNVSKIYVPEGYNFERLIQKINKYALPNDHNQYLNNYDYQLALVMLNGVPYMSAHHIVLTESTSEFGPVATLHYEFYQDLNQVEKALELSKDSLQVVLSHADIKNALPFGSSQKPGISDFADGEDTFEFLLQHST